MVIADFGVGSNREERDSGVEVSQLIRRDLQETLHEKGLDQKVEIRKAPVIRTERYADELYANMGADVLIWGWLTTAYSEDGQRYAVPSVRFDVPFEAETTLETPPLFHDPIAFNNPGQPAVKISDEATILINLCMAGVYLEEKDYYRAGQELNYAIRRARRMQGELEVEVNKGNKSLRELENFNKGLAWFLTVRGMAHQANKDFEQAKVDFEEAVTLDQDSERPHIALGNYYYTQSELESAEGCYRFVLDHRNHRSYVAHYGLGSVQYVSRDYRAAIAEFEHAIEDSEYLNVQFPLAHFARGIAFFRIGELTEALTSLQQAKQLAKDDPSLAGRIEDALNVVQREIATRELLTASPQPSPTPTASSTAPPKVATPATSTTPLRSSATPTPAPGHAATATTTPTPTLLSSKASGPASISPTEDSVPPLPGDATENQGVGETLLPAPELLEPQDGDIIESRDQVRLRWASDYSLQKGEMFLVTLEYPASFNGTRERRQEKLWVDDAYEVYLPSHLAYYVEDLSNCTWTVTIVHTDENATGDINRPYEPISQISRRQFVLRAWKPGFDTSAQIIPEVRDQ